MRGLSSGAANDSLYRNTTTTTTTTIAVAICKRRRICSDKDPIITMSRQRPAFRLHVILGSRLQQPTGVSTIAVDQTAADDSDCLLHAPTVYACVTEYAAQSA